MDPGRQAMLSRCRSPKRRDGEKGKDNGSRRRDSNNRITKSSKSSSSRPRQRNNRSNYMTQDEQSRQFVADEDKFVLKQAKKKADIRVREGRAKPIDLLAFNLRFVDSDRDVFEDEDADIHIEVPSPEDMLQGLDDSRLQELESDMTSYHTLEQNDRNRDYWRALQTICADRRQKLKPQGPDARVVSTVSEDIDSILRPKTYEQLEALESQIQDKLRSNADIDVDYWEQLLSSLLVWKAKAKLKKVCDAISESKASMLKLQDPEKALVLSQQQKAKAMMAQRMNRGSGQKTGRHPRQQHARHNGSYPGSGFARNNRSDKYHHHHHHHQNHYHHHHQNRHLNHHLNHHHQHQQNQHQQQSRAETKAVSTVSTTQSGPPPGTARFAQTSNEDFSQATKALYDREVARGIGEGEEIFTAEEAVPSAPRPTWAHKHRPRKPRYFNRVQMGYEWNKYNQTHYDHDNPPPKVVLGYKFNIFYPELIDKTKAPTFKIIRDHAKKKGESSAGAGEEGTCLIRFIAGPPYEDIAFRIVDREWDYSAKRERGFRSFFDKGILQLHFQFKKIYYRK